MTSWKGFLRFLLTTCILFVLLLAFSLAHLDPGTEAGKESYVVSVMALVPALLTIVGASLVLYVDWDPF